MTIEECRKILKENGESHSAEEAKEIMVYLDNFVTLSWEEYQLKKKLNESDNIYPCIDR